MISFLKRRPKSEYEGTPWSDLKALFARSAINWPALLGAIAVPGTIAVAFVMERVDAEYIPPEVTWVNSYAPNRTIEEIRAQQAKDLPAELKEEADIKAAEEARRAEYRKLADLFGIEAEQPVVRK